MIVIQSSMRRMCTATRLTSSSRDRSVETAEPSAIAEGSRGLSPKNFDTQRERHLQPLVDGIGASEQETCCN